MRSIDNRVRDLAIRELERDGGASLAINISGLTATERSWFRGLVARLKERRDIATRLIVEITETAALQDIDETSRRSEEHTSELQSLMRISYAVFCLKKKK